MGPGFFYYHRGPDGPQIRRALLLLAISGLLAFALYAGAQMRPLLGSLATTRVSNAVNRIGRRKRPLRGNADTHR